MGKILTNRKEKLFTEVRICYRSGNDGELVPGRWENSTFQRDEVKDAGVSVAILSR